MDELAVRRAVRNAYGARAESGCCGTVETTGSAEGTGQAKSEPRTESKPAKLGLGDPVSASDLRPGETVLDLGSGLGTDAFNAASVVGPTGRVLGVDATPEMVFTSREAAAKQGLSNVEFRLGEIEHLPVGTASVDVVVSDCVINLSPDKAQVFREAYRVLRPGGRIVVSDVVTDQELPEVVRRDTRAWAACVAGAVTEAEYVTLLREAGFQEIRTSRRGPWMPGLSTALVTARKD